MVDADMNDMVKEMDRCDLYTNKPWGFKHTSFKDNNCIIWRLLIKEGEATSYHCHPNKKTMMIVLKGKMS